MAATTLATILQARGGNEIPPRALQEFQQPLLEQLMRLTAERDDGLAPLLTPDDILVDTTAKTWSLTLRPTAWGTERESVAAYGELLLAILEAQGATHGNRLADIARRCRNHDAATLADAHTLFERAINRRIYSVLLLVLAAALLALYLHYHGSL